jgi:DegV family protein with EDD domain
MGTEAMMVGVVTDSAASVAPGLASSYRIAIAPMSLDIDGVPCTDESVGIDEVARLVRAGSVVKTAAPTPGAFLAAIEGANRGKGVAVITVGGSFSSTGDAARLAAGMTDVRVEVIDSGTAAGAEGLVVLRAAQVALAGASFDEVVRAATDVRRRVRLVAEVGDLTYLIRGGRVPSSLGAIGNAVGVRPVFELRGGNVRPMRPMFSSHAAFDLMVSTFRKSLRPGHALHVAGLHVGAPEQAERLLDAVCNVVEPATRFAAPFGPAMVAHTGPGLRGLAWWWEPQAGS